MAFANTSSDAMNFKNLQSLSAQISSCTLFKDNIDLFGARSQGSRVLLPSDEDTEIAVLCDWEHDVGYGASFARGIRYWVYPKSKTTLDGATIYVTHVLETTAREEVRKALSLAVLELAVNPQMSLVQYRV